MEVEVLPGSLSLLASVLAAKSNVLPLCKPRPCLFNDSGVPKLRNMGAQPQVITPPGDSSLSPSETSDACPKAPKLQSLILGLQGLEFIPRPSQTTQVSPRPPKGSQRPALDSKTPESSPGLLGTQNPAPGSKEAQIYPQVLRVPTSWPFGISNLTADSKGPSSPALDLKNPYSQAPRDPSSGYSPISTSHLPSVALVTS